MNSFFRMSSQVIIGMGLVAPASIMACPICNSPTGQQVREGIFGGSFWETFLVVSAPFPVLILCIAAYHFGLPASFRPHSGSSTYGNPPKP